MTTICSQDGVFLCCLFSGLEALVVIKPSGANYLHSWPLQVVPCSYVISFYYFGDCEFGADAIGVLWRNGGEIAMDFSFGIP